MYNLFIHPVDYSISTIITTLLHIKNTQKHHFLAKKKKPQPPGTCGASGL